MTTPPVRVQRPKGWRKALPITREEFRAAVVYAESWARTITWKDVEDLLHGLAFQIGEQMGRPIHALLVGQHDVDDMPVIRIHMGEFNHHVVCRSVNLLENNTPELMLGEARIEEMVAARMREAKARAGKIKDKLAEKVGAEARKR